MFIVWYGYDSWNITKLPFQRTFIEDRNGDGIFELIEYYHSANKNGDVYKFDKGNLLYF
jgi:hypothetical protein